MPKAEQASPETLFHHWRRGDANAGKAMAQRFTDWYYAIAVSRFGEADGNAIFRAAASRFSKGVVKVEDPRRLLSWAHGIAHKQVTTRQGGARLLDGDLPNGFTRRRHPKEILVEARAQLPEAMSLLERAYAGKESPDLLRLLKARYALKSWLATHAEVPFRVTPTDPDADNAPMTLYEAGRLPETEETLFELYMLNGQDLCQDVAEFAHFALALRGGLPGMTPSADARPARPAPPRPDEIVAQQPQETKAPLISAPEQAAPVQQASNTPFLVIGVIVLVAVIAALWFAATYAAHG